MASWPFAHRDEPERLVLPLAPRGAGRWVVERVAPAREQLDLPAPPAPASEPPAEATPPAEASPPAGASNLALRPPIPRGSPLVATSGRGGRVTLDVRVDEAGGVSDVALVQTDADSLTVHAAIEAAYACRYLPAMLGERRVAVWARQVFEVAHGGGRRP